MEMDEKTYVATCRIIYPYLEEGCSDWYDAYQDVEIQPSTLSGAKDLVLANLPHWAETRRIYQANLVDLLDNHDNVVAEAAIKYEGDAMRLSWISVDDLDLERTTKRIEELEREAHVEAGWDNHSTADSLRSRAQSLERLMSIHTNSPLLAQTQLELPDHHFERPRMRMAG